MKEGKLYRQKTVKTPIYHKPVYYIFVLTKSYLYLNNTNKYLQRIILYYTKTNSPSFNEYHQTHTDKIFDNFIKATLITTGIFMLNAHKKIFIAYSCQINIIIILCIVSFLCVSPFLFLRLKSGDVFSIGINIVAMSSYIIAGLIAWLKHDARVSAAILSSSFFITTSVVIYKSGYQMYIPWVPITMIGMYFILNLKSAMIINLMFFITISPEIIKLDNDLLKLSIVMTLCISNMFGVTYAYNVNKQLKHWRDKLKIDHLTGVYNRKALDEGLLLAIERKQRLQSTTSLIMIDIDYFKKINDNYGHETGDIVLKQCCGFFKKNIRKNDFIYRFGGEEFVILAPNISIKDAYKFAEKLRKSLVSYKQVKHPVTVSIGVAELSRDENSESWLKRADSALYDAKYSGRNNSQIAHPYYPQPQSGLSVPPLTS